MKNRNAIFIVVGRLGKNLVVSKTLPVIFSKVFSDVYIFSEEIGPKIDGAKYIILPAFIRHIKYGFVKRIVRIVWEPVQLGYYAWRLQPSIIHGYYSIPKGLNSLFASKLSGSSCIISIIGGKEEIETAFFIQRISRPLIIWLLKKAHHITTKGIRDNEYLFRNGVNKEKISVFNGAIDTKRFCYRGEVKNIDLLFAGHFNESKGPQRALEIIRKVSEVIPNIQAVFIGNGPLYQSIRDEITNLRLTKYISIIGHVANSEYYFIHSKILLFPSANEGLSTAMLEAMACRCVPITSDVGNQTEAALHDNNSIVIPDYNNILSFSEQALRLLMDQSLLNQMAENAEKTIIAKYTPEVQGKLCQQFYSQLIQRN